MVYNFLLPSLNFHIFSKKRSLGIGFRIEVFLYSTLGIFTEIIFCFREVSKNKWNSLISQTNQFSVFSWYPNMIECFWLYTTTRFTFAESIRTHMSAVWEVVHFYSKKKTQGFDGSGMFWVGSFVRSRLKMFKNSFSWIMHFLIIFLHF